MPEAEARHPCPVCLGVKLSKLRIVPGDELTLDRCERCGGVWFDEGEVTRLRDLRPEAAWQKVALSGDAFRMSCHSCRSIMDRNAARCASCGWGNVLDCPICASPMKRHERQGLMLDGCSKCRGVWFDRIELAAIWNLQLETPRSSALAVPPIVAEAGEVAAEIVLWNPELLVVGGRALGQGAQAVASGAAEVVGSAPQMVGTAVEVGGEVAGSVFKAIAEIIGAIFD